MRMHVQKQLRLLFLAMSPKSSAARRMESDGARLISRRVHIVVTNDGRDARRIAVFAAKERTRRFRGRRRRAGANQTRARIHSHIGILIVAITNSDPKIISTGQQGLKLFEIVHDRVRIRPDEMRLLRWPLWVVLYGRSVIRVIKCSSRRAKSAGSEDQRKTAARLALGPLRYFKRLFLKRVPKGSGGACGVVAAQIKRDVTAIRRAGAPCGGHPEIRVRPLRAVALGQDVRPRPEPTALSATPARYSAKSKSASKRR